MCVTFGVSGNPANPTNPKPDTTRQVSHKVTCANGGVQITKGDITAWCLKMGGQGPRASEFKCVKNRPVCAKGTVLHHKNAKKHPCTAKGGKSRADDRKKFPLQCA
ncbi:uncharacterized protein MELLADRAFT_103838 [Melampsora larici-populina 98AG31]|uniref:Uncharacterized protein n=1 Tax=Melampsora larici-populina (strain 98AG31 / pathotype 3-4-7) TaxID=747676 RepID=F4RCM2_MELLP|nr:uncharacterized protein MELLADRAFT_103838 [Melampsora larici-populina 98AG31]EGG09759.1 hypothetical protein MELLADRAFT_103838 [Melampsora larici-populina 98AG31]